MTTAIGAAQPSTTNAAAAYRTNVPLAVGVAAAGTAAAVALPMASKWAENAWQGLFDGTHPASGPFFPGVIGAAVAASAVTIAVTRPRDAGDASRTGGIAGALAGLAAGIAHLATPGFADRLSPGIVAFELLASTGAGYVLGAGTSSLLGGSR